MSGDRALEACFRINKEWGGVAVAYVRRGESPLGDLKSLVKATLEEILPHDAHERM